MGILSDAYKELATPADPAGARDTLPTILGQGLESGALGARSQLQSLAGGVAEAMDADQFAQARYADASDLRNRAQAAAPVISSSSQVGGVRDAVDFAAGMVGQSIPVSAAALGAAALTGGGAVPGMIAATAATAPFEIGDQLQRQQLDPTLRKAPISERLTNAGLYGTGSALAQSVVPAIVGGKVMGKTANTAAKTSATGIVGRGLADAGLEGVTEGLGEGIKQFGEQQIDPTRQFDLEAIRENAIGGAAGGLGMGTIGMTGEMVHGGLDVPKSLIGKGVKKVQDVVGPEGMDLGGKATKLMGQATDLGKQAVDAVGPEGYDLGGKSQKLMGQAVEAGKSALDAAGPVAYDLAGKGSKLMGQAAEAGKEGLDTAGPAAYDLAGKASRGVKAGLDALNRLRNREGVELGKMADGAEFTNPEAFKDKQGEELKRAVDADDQTRAERAGSYLAELASTAMDPATHAKVKAAATDLSSKANQAIIAGAKRTADAVKRGSAMLDQMAATYKQTYGEKKAELRANRESKKSEDYGGLDKAISDNVTQFVQERLPHLNADANRGKLASVLRNTLLETDRGDLSSDTIAGLMDLAGEHASELLARAGEARRSASKDMTGYFKGMQALMDASQKREDLVDTLGKMSLQEHSRDTLNEVASGLTRWAQTPATNAQEEAINTERVRRELRSHFGANADKVLEAVQASIKVNENQIDGKVMRAQDSDDVLGEVEGSDEFANPNDRARSGDVFEAGEVPGASKLRVFSISSTKSADPKYAPPIERALNKAQTANPNRKLNRVPLDQLGENHPAVEKKYRQLYNEALLQETKTLMDVHDVDGATAAAMIDHAKIQRMAEAQLPDHEAVVSEESENPLALTGDEVAGIKLDAGRGHSASRLEIGPRETVDAVKLTRLMHQRAQDADRYNPTDDQGKQHRIARMFKEGLAALSDYTGKAIEPPDSLVIGNGLTWGEAKKLDVRSEKDKEGDADTGLLTELRRKYQGVKSGSEDQLAALRDKFREAGSPLDQDRVRDAARNVEERTTLELDRVREEARPTAAKKEFALAREQVETPESLEQKRNQARMEAQDDLKALEGFLKDMQRQQPVGEDGVEALARKQADMQARIDRVRAKIDDLVDRSTEYKNRQALAGEQRYEADVELDPLGPTIQRRGPAGDQLPEGIGFIREGKDGSLEQRRASDSKMIAGIIDRLSDQDDLTPYQQDTLTLATAAQTKLGQLGPNASHREAAALRQELDRLFARGYAPEGSPDPKAVAAKKAAFLEKARSGDASLIETLRASDDAKGLQRASEALVGVDGVDATRDAIHERLGELLQDPEVSYGLQTRAYSMERTAGNPVPDESWANVARTVRRMLGHSVDLDLKANIPYAGEFQELLNRPGGVDGVIRVGALAMNPLSVAYHESLHALFHQLNSTGNGRISTVLHEAASSGTVMLQLRENLKNSPEALAQLNNPEERAAYMFQFWATKQLVVNKPATTLFERVVKFVRDALGIWSNDQRAEHIMRHFSEGKYAKQMGDRNAVARSLMAPGRNAALESLKEMIAPLTDVGQKIAVAGHQRLRDTGIPALRELADMMKLDGAAQGSDPGFLPAARLVHTRMINDLADKLYGYSEQEVSDALELMHHGVTDAAGRVALGAQRKYEFSAKADPIVKSVRDTLDKAFAYMRKAGVEVNDLGVGTDYFPRVWDAAHIASHQEEFLAALRPYEKAMGFPAENLLHMLMHSDGSELSMPTDRPGMQHIKPRNLAMIPADVAAPFLNKNMYRTLNSYLMQAARRAEWARRFGDDNFGLKLLIADAQKQGATADDIDAARKYLQAVDGTLGDTISPGMRKLQGNLIVYQNVRLLPLAIFSSIVDPMGILVRGGTLGDSWRAFTRGIREVRRGFQSDPNLDDTTELAQLMGVIDNAMMTHTLGTAYTQGMVGDRARRINDTFFRFNLMEQFNTSMRVGAMEAAISFMGKHADGKASPHSARWMAELGFQPGELQLDDEGRPKLTVDDGLTQAQAGKVRTAINRWVDGAVLRPDAADKPIWMSDPRWALISHLKQFVFSFQETILKRAVHEAKHGNMGAVYGLAGYVPVMIAADMVKAGVTGAAGGGEAAWKKDWTELLAQGTQRAGLFGVGQFGVDALGSIRRGESGLGHLAGPTIEQLGEAIHTAGGQGSFSHLLIRSMPANALYAGALRGAPAAESIHPE